MTVWSAEQLSSVAKKHMRLPRARSSPNTRNWTLQRLDRDAGVAGGLFESEEPRSLNSSTPVNGRSGALCGAAATALRQKSFLFCGPRPQNSGHHRSKSNFSQARDTQLEQAELRRSQQIGAAHSNKEAGHGDRAGCCSAQDIPCAMLPGRADKVLLGSESMDPIASMGGPELPQEANSTKVLGVPLSGRSPKVLPGPSLPSMCSSASRAHTQDLSASAPAACVPPKKVHRELNSGPKQLSRKMSLQSEVAMKQLAELDVTLADIEQRVEQFSRLANEPAQLTLESVASIKTALAQAEAEANKLETKGVDSIYTSELKSGHASAKESKKAQLRRLEKLFVVIEDVFRLLNTANQNLHRTVVPSIV